MTMHSLKGYFVLVVVLFVGVSRVKTQEVQPSCVEALDTSLASPSSDLCEADRQYMRCIVKDHSLQYLGVGADYLTRFRNRIHAQLLKQGIDCDIDIMNLTRAVRLEDLTERFNAMDIPVREFANATDLLECAQAFVYAATSTGGVTCDFGRALTKCAARVTAMYATVLPGSYYTIFQEDAELTLEALGENCVIDVPSIIAELRAEADVNPATEVPVETTGSSSQDQGVSFDNATTVADCISTVTRVQTASSLTCDLVRSYTKCMLRFSDLPLTPLDPLKAKSIKNKILEELNALDLECDLDIQGIIDELLAEQKVEDVTEAITVSLSTTTTTKPTTTTTTTTTTMPTTTTTTTARPATVPATTRQPIAHPSDQNREVVTFDQATTFEGCSRVLSSFGPQVLSCEALILHTRCVLRVLKLQNTDSLSSLSRYFQRQLQNSLNMVGSDCVIDIQKILDDLRGVQRTGGCINNNPDGCVNAVNGDYPVCSIECREGVYITCSNAFLHVRSCPLAWYLTPRGNRYTASMVYDPVTGHCQTSTPSCPRPLDQLIPSDF